MCLKSRGEPLQVIRALAGPAAHHGAELPHHGIRKIVIRRRRPQQIRVELRRILNVRGSTGKQLKDLWVVHDLRPFRVCQQRLKRLQRFPLFVEPHRAAFARLRRNLDRSDARPEAFGLSLARLEIQPNGQRLFRRQFCKVFSKFRDGGELYIFALCC